MSEIMYTEIRMNNEQSDKLQKWEELNGEDAERLTERLLINFIDSLYESKNAPEISGIKLFCPICGELTDHTLEELKEEFRFIHKCGAHFWVEDSVCSEINVKEQITNRINRKNMYKPQ